MNNKKVFCEVCRNFTNYTILNEKLLGTIKGEVYEYNGENAYCANCSSNIFVPKINDSNLKSLYDEFRKKNDIISLEKILEILEKYKIGKRPLSLLLGWGEQTFSRYCDGDIPTKQYSLILKKIYENPFFYNNILEENKDKLKSHLAYKKSKDAVNKLIGNNLNEKSKINMVIIYLLNKCEDITPLALQKILYYVEGFYYAFYNEFLFTEDCRAWVHGPVYTDVYYKYKDYKFDPIKINEQVDYSTFSSLEIEILESVSENIACFSGKVLEKFTHLESPWLDARKKLKDKEASNKIIPKEKIGEYFKNVKNRYNMKEPSDIKMYAKEMFEKI